MTPEAVICRYLNKSNIFLTTGVQLSNKRLALIMSLHFEDTNQMYIIFNSNLILMTFNLESF